MRNDNLVTDTGGDLRELQNTEFHNGIIVPGFVNCHCHLELSAMKGVAPRGSGLGEFIKTVREQRELPGEKIAAAIKRGDRDMYHEGISACGDICNNSSTFDTKQHSPVKYVNFLEVVRDRSCRIGEKDGRG
ncbi:MAG: amidohydrolase family protein [Bacteroidales bacterium]